MKRARCTTLALTTRALALALAFGAPGGGATAAEPAAAAASAAASAAAPVPTDALRLIDLWLDAQVRHDRVPTLSAGVVIGQDLAWSRGYGHVDSAGRVPVDADTVYSVCSISKLFTSIALMQQWEAGRVSLDDDVARHVPAMAIRRSDPDSAPITLRSLLMHASGLPREADASYWREGAFPSREQLLERLRGQSTIARSYERHQYSNLGMALLGEVVGAVAGQPTTEVVARQVLAPLGMADTRAGLPLDLLGRRLPPGQGPLQRDGTRAVLPPFDTAGLQAAAGYTSTVRDLARFAAWQLRLLQRGGSEVLKVATLREMQRVQWQDADGRNTWGLGFAVSRDGSQNLVSHAGLCPGYRSAWVLAPREGFAVIAMTATTGSENAPYTRPIRQLLNKGWKVAPAKDAEAMAAYVGRYDANPWNSELVVVPWGEGLAMLSLPTGDPAGDLGVLRRVDGDRFRFVRDDGSLGTELRFERDAQGRVSGYTLWAQRTQRLGPLR